VALAAMPDLTLSGFGTLGASWFSSDDADFVPNVAPSGPGRSRAVDLGLDSRLGVQLDLDFGPATRASVQVLSERNPEGNVTPQLSLANLRHEFTPNLSARLGRVQTPQFIAAEHRLVGYALPWIRPPIPVYGLFPLVAQDGVDLAYRDWVDWGTVSLRAGLFHLETEVARSNSEATDNLDVEGGRFLRLDLERGAWQASATLSRMRVNYATPGLQAALGFIAQFDPKSAEALAYDDAPFTVASFGLVREDADTLLMAEWGGRYSDNVMPDAWGAYVTFGRRFGGSMPYATLGRRETSGANVRSPITTLNPLIAQLTSYSNFDQWTVSLGLSQRLWDTALLKLQWDAIKPDKGSWGPYLNHGPGYDPADPPLEHLFSVNVDFIF
jgi:hypothetical protein